VAVIVVVVLLNWPLAPLLAGAVNVTDTPETGLPYWSSTVATRALKAVATVTLCGVPEAVTMLAAAPAVFVKLNEAVGVTPLAAAVTVKLPACVLAVKLSDN
jgi:hypothetical protein